MSDERLVTTHGLEPNRMRKLVSSGINYLSADKEGTPFLLFLLGDDIDTVAFKSGYPKDIIEITAIHYKWDSKRNLIRQNNGEDLVTGLQKNLVNLLLVATYTAIRQELTDVLSGKKEAKDCLLIPKTTHSLTQLMDLAQSVNKVGGAVQVDGQNITNIQAQNVQIVNPAQPVTPEETAKKIEEHSKMLKLLAGKT